jgi:tryptophanyl-tRNA synthetase
MVQTTDASQKPDSPPVVFSGVQPSGILTLGTMIGALNNWVYLQDTYACYFCVVDMHAITVRQKPADLRKWTLDCAATFLAAGIDPERSTVFVQSHVPAHAELAWVLSTFTGFGEAGRMTQFKDKSQQHEENVNVGLFTYPILMVADILLYQANLVPVGEDQKQHLELTRDLAQRFNNAYSPTFAVPEPFIPKAGGRVMSLQDPTKKMSKSDPNQGATIFLTDTDDEIRNKIKRAVTDSGTDIVYDELRPGIANLMELHHIATGKALSEIEDEFRGKGYGAFKSAVAESVVEYVRPVRDRFVKIRADVPYLSEVLHNGAAKASGRAKKTLRSVYRKIGFWAE